MAQVTLGIDVGGTKIAAGAVDPDGRILERVQVPTPAQDPDAIVRTIVDLARRLGAGDRIDQVGVCVAGFVDKSRSQVIFSPNLAWRDVPLREQIEESLGVECAIENDANAAAWGEFRFGAGRDPADLLMVTVGTGVGGGIVIDGNLVRGGFGIAAEIGHIGLVPQGERCGCGNLGCLEAYGSGTALVRATRRAAGQDPQRAAGLIEGAGGNVEAITGPQITAAALAGDEFAKGQFEDLGGWLGLGVANIAEIIDPSVVIVGGGVSRAGEVLLGPMRASVRRHLSGAEHRPILSLRLAEMGNDAGLVGVADLARIAVAG